MNTLWNDFRAAWQRTDNVLVQLILVNVLVFASFAILRVIFPADWLFAIEHNLAMPGSAWQFLFKPWTLLSYAFFHEGIWHILSNMLFLWAFGRVINEMIGHRKLLALYVLGAFVAGMAYLLIYNTVPTFTERAQSSILLGASGAVYAIMVGAATLVPDYRFNLLLIGPVKIVYIAAFFVFFSFIEIPMGNPGGNIAHLGGSLIGWLYISQLRNGRDLGKPILGSWDWVRGLFSSQPRMKVTQGERIRRPVSTLEDDPEESEIDEILDKINRKGYEGLSKEEKQKLFRYSQKN